MVLTQDSIQVAQGALYLIDHIGHPPPGMDFRQFTDHAITDHLKQHTYYYRPRVHTGPNNREVVTLVRMRRSIRDLLAKAKPSFYQAESNQDDNADRIFRKGTTKGFPDDLLRKYGYDRATFSEADLPGYTAQAEEAEDDENALEAPRQQSGNSMGPQPKQPSTGNLGPRAASKKRPRESVSPSPSPSRSSQKSFGSAEDVSSEEDKDEEDDEYYDAKHNVNMPNKRPKLQPQAEASANPPAIVSSSAAEEMTIDAENFTENVEQTTKRARGRPSKQAPHVGKRKRGDEDVGDSVQDEVAVKPTESKKSKTSNDLSLTAERPQFAIPGAASQPRASSELTFGTSTPLEAGIRRDAGYPSGMQSNMNEVQDSQSSRPAEASQDGKQQPQPVFFDIDAKAQAFERFYDKIAGATDRVLASIGDIGNTLSYLDENPSERLEALYARCWGSNWDAVRVKLTKEFVFTTPEVVMSVVSAFLFDNVLNQQASIQDVQAKQLELKGTMGRAILRTLDLESGENELAKVARAIESEDARIRLAEGDKSGSLQHELHAEAEKFTNELWDIILPHFRGLSRLAVGYGLSFHRPEQDWREAFDKYFPDIFEAILRYRLELLATGYEHEYIWPEAYGEFDLLEMGIHGALLPIPLQVLWTVFFGVKVEPHGSTVGMRAYPGMKAMVKVKKPYGT